ncbi:hypothetical protein EON65_26280 [archaeon]|nr:MAG: hypothetical protein EON65_26280 [archaeon]
MPLKDLDSIRDSQIEAIDFHMKRVERWILYLLDMAMQPSRDNPLEPPKEDVVNVNRISKAARQITEFLRNALAGFAQVCAQIRESYNNADFEVRRMLLEAKTLHLMTEKERPKTAIRPKSPIRQKADQQKVSSIALRPLSAPATTSVSKSLSFFEDRQHDTDDNHGEVDESAHVEAGKSYGSDFEDMVSDSKNNLSRLNSRTSVQSVQSVEDYIVEDVEEKESRQIDGIEEESRGNRSKSRSNNDSYGEDEDHQEAKQQQEEYAKDEVGGFDDQNELMEDQADLKASKKKKSKKGKRSRKVLPTGNELRENLQLAKVKDDKVARKQLLFKLLDRSNPPTNSTGRPYTSPPRTRSPPPISNTSYQRDFEFDSNLDEQDDKHNPLPPVRMCFHCYKEIVGRGVHTPKLTTSGKESWQVAQTDLSRTNSRFPDHLRKIEIGAEIFDLSKTFLAKLQASATNVSQGEPAFCTWECVKKWALGHCPLQHRYQTDILINMAAGYLVDV